MPLIRWPRPRVESAAPVTRCTEYLLYSPNNQANFAVLFPKPLGVASEKERPPLGLCPRYILHIGAGAQHLPRTGRQFSATLVSTQKCPIKSPAQAGASRQMRRGLSIRPGTLR